ncbi:serine/threonine protein kinase [Paenibacillus wulumuqiensis]|uniref:serine/threonine protein kinase n=1 Tax=Paenibacillus wulumuqiensis TaxID=1567107 RepID=UPI00128DA187|nr:protein kinase family protein [Paenibacillus wulumuqiensis]
MRALQRMNGHIQRWLQERNFRPGQVIRERYRIIERLGTGSYGVAYRCDDRVTGELCVLKRVHPLRGGRQRAELIYDRELQAMSRLRHKQVPTLLDSFIYKGQRCLAMEYMQGMNIGQLLFEEERTFTEQESLQLMHQLLDIVQTMHHQGLIHRDISLSNVLWYDGTAHLIDFGLTWREEEPPELVHELDELVSGDEQEKKIRRSLDVSSDFYGIGHLLLYLLYSTYDDLDGQQERSWEQELQIHPRTRRMLRRLLLIDPPYTDAAEIITELEAILAEL